MGRKRTEARWLCTEPAGAVDWEKNPGFCARYQRAVLLALRECGELTPEQYSRADAELACRWGSVLGRTSAGDQP